MTIKKEYWIDAFEPREIAQIRHALEYAEKHSTSGVPGHSQFMLIAKLAKLLDEVERKYIDLGTT